MVKFDVIGLGVPPLRMAGGLPGQGTAAAG
jgi:hypothetical protein